MPDDIVFKTNPEIAIEIVHSACANGLPSTMVLFDASYGHNAKLRTAVTELRKPMWPTSSRKAWL
jgi:SRSO17 transposase